MTEPIVAFRVEYAPLGDIGVYGAPRRSVATMRALGGALSAGYGAHWKDFRARRAPEFDALVAKHGMVCWSSEYAALMLKDHPHD